MKKVRKFCLLVPLCLAQLSLYYKAGLYSRVGHEKQLSRRESAERWNSSLGTSVMQSETEEGEFFLMATLGDIRGGV